MSVAEAQRISEPTAKGSFWSELALHERMLRKACSASSEADALQCVAGELWPYVPHRWAWIAQLDTHRAEAELSVSWPESEAWKALPRALPVGPSLTEGALGGRPGVYCGTRPTAEPYDEALRALGVQSHITFGLACQEDAPRLVTFAAPASVEYDSDQIAFAKRISPSVAAALSLTVQEPGPGVGSAWGGLDPVEIVHYACRAMAHDVRNIMSGIIGAIELQRADMNEADAPVFGAVRRRALEGVAMAEAMTARLERLVARQGGPVDLREIAQQVVALLKPVLRSASDGIAPSLRCSGCPAPAIADAGELRRAVSALVFNAVRAVGAGGEIQLRTRVDRRRAILEVIDNGTGMTQEVWRRAKEPFYTTESGEHLGLGLTIADGVARRFGGSLAVRPNGNRGVRVALTLPLDTHARPGQS